MLAIYDWFGYQLPIVERYRLIKESGFDGVLLWWGGALGRGDYLAGPHLARQAGLFVENAHAPFQYQDYIWQDNADGQDAAKSYLQCVTECAERDVPTLVIHLPDDDKPHTELGLKRIQTITEQAERLSVNIALENLNNLENLRHVLARIDSPRLGFCYDYAHHQRYCPDRDILTYYSSRLMALHLHDYSDTQQPHRLPFDGIIDWPGAMGRLAKARYNDSICIEVMNWSYEHIHIERFLYMAFERAQRLQAMLGNAATQA